VQKDGKSQIAMFFRIALQIPSASIEQGTCADEIPRRVVMEGDRDLNQSLQELLLFRQCGAPNVFPDLVCVEEAAAVEQVESA
jgi:hypothetical protein